jgi:hypothetical protein
MSDSGRAELAVKDRTGRRELMHNDENDGNADGQGKLPIKDDHVILPREAQGRIGQHLRRIYGEILAEPLPDKFSKLLNDLAKSERSE